VKNKLTKQKRERIRRMIRKNIENSLKYYCVNCGEEFESLKELNRHRKKYEN
jgi:lipopolysaccharide biosynthesis regulator YciM